MCTHSNPLTATPQGTQTSEFHRYVECWVSFCYLAYKLHYRKNVCKPGYKSIYLKRGVF